MRSWLTKSAGDGEDMCENDISMEINSSSSYGDDVNMCQMLPRRNGTIGWQQASLW